MRSKVLAVFSAFVLSATALQAQTPTTAPVDINTATRTEIAAAGWGDYADAIIAARPYKSMNDLVEKKVVPPQAYEKGYSQFTIGDGTTPLSDPNKSSPTLNPPPVTPPTVTPGTTTPTTTTTPPPTVTPGTTPPTTTTTTPPPTVTPPTATPGATSPTTTTPPPTVTPNATTPSVAPGTTPAAPSK